MTKPRLLASVFLLAIVVVHGLVAWLSPLQGNDWNHLMWTRAHADDTTAAFAAAWLVDHATFHDAVGFVLAHSTLVHAIVTPLVGCALLWGMFVTATRRQPNLDDWLDVVALLMLSAFLLLAAPRAGVTLFHRPYVAQWIYGSTITLWFLVPFRCGDRLPHYASPLLAVAGFCAGGSSRMLGFAALILVTISLFRTSTISRWMWAAFAGLAIGVVLSLFDQPQVDFTGFRSSFDATMSAIDIATRGNGQVTSLVLLVTFAKLVLARIRPRTADSSTLDTSETLSWLGLWLTLVFLGMFGPKFGEATLFPASITLCIASYPYIAWLANTPALRILLGVIGIGTHVVAWSMSLSTYVVVNEVFHDRMERLKGGTSVVDLPPYYPIRPNFWFFGEDFGPIRQLVATSLFELQDITISPPFRGYERSPDLKVHLEVENVTGAQLQRARPPRQWATAPSVARKQHRELVRRLLPIAGKEIAVRLVVDMTFDGARNRPILAANYERGHWSLPRIRRRAVDETSQVPIIVRPESFTEEYPEAFALNGVTETRVVPTNGVYRLHTLTTKTHILVACDPVRCILVDALVPNL